MPTSNKTYSHMNGNILRNKILGYSFSSMFCLVDVIEHHKIQRSIISVAMLV